MKKLNILVTGYSGCLGNELTNQLLYHPMVGKLFGCNRGGITEIWRGKSSGYGQSLIYSASGKSFDLAGMSYVNKLYELTQPNLVIHTAGNPNTNVVWQETFASNVQATWNLVNLAPRGCKFVLASSLSVYGDSGRIKPCDENTLPAATSIYGASKVACEQAVLAAHSLGNVEGLILRYAAIASKNSGHGCLKAIAEKIRSAKADEVIELYGYSPGAVKPYITVGNAARYTINLAINSRTDGVWNIAPSDNISIFEIFNQAMARRSPMQHNYCKFVGDAWPGDNHFVKADNKKLTDYLGHCVPSSEDAIIYVLKELLQ